MSKVIWNEDLTDLSNIMFADMCDARVKPWEYLRVYPDFRRMSLIRIALMLDVAIGSERPQTSLVKLYMLSEAKLLREVYSRVDLLDSELHPEGNEISFCELLDDLFAPFAKRGITGLFTIKCDTHNGILPGARVPDGASCPYPEHPFMLECYLRKILPGYRFVKSNPDAKEMYILPSGKSRYNVEVLTD